MNDLFSTLFFILYTNVNLAQKHYKQMEKNVPNSKLAPSIKG